MLGLLLYWLVGPNFRYFADKRRFRRKREHLEILPADLPRVDQALRRPISSVIYSCSGMRVLEGNSARLLLDGGQTYQTMFAAFERARQSILLETYILRNDSVGERLQALLEKKARDGVLVCLIFDAVGSWRIGISFVRSLRSAGVHVHSFLQVSFPMFRAANYRNHRKIAIVDNETAFMGGLNIGKEYLGQDQRFGYWRDTHLCLTGPAVASLRQIFLQDLLSCGAPESLLRAIGSAEPGGKKFSGTIPLQIASSGPDNAWDTIRQAYFTLISRAEKRVWINTPYLIPGDGLLSALCASSLSGTDVRIIIPAQKDTWLVHWATLNTCEDLLRAGVRIYLYRKDRFMHAKTMTSDGSVYSIGSANLDTRSLHINFEVQAFIYDAALAQEAEEIFLRDIENSQELCLTLWAQRPLLARFKENLGKLFSSLA